MHNTKYIEYINTDNAASAFTVSEQVRLCLNEWLTWIHSNCNNNVQY